MRHPQPSGCWTGIASPNFQEFEDGRREFWLPLVHPIPVHHSTRSNDGLLLAWKWNIELSLYCDVAGFLLYVPDNEIPSILTSICHFLLKECQLSQILIKRWHYGISVTILAKAM